MAEEEEEEEEMNCHLLITSRRTYKGRDNKDRLQFNILFNFDYLIPKQVSRIFFPIIKINLRLFCVPELEFHG